MPCSHTQATAHAVQLKILSLCPFHQANSHLPLASLPWSPQSWFCHPSLGSQSNISFHFAVLYCYCIVTHLSSLLLFKCPDSSERVLWWCHRYLCSDDVTGICIRAAITKYHRLGGLNNKNLFLTVLEATSSRSRCQLAWFLLRPLLGL